MGKEIYLSDLSLRINSTLPLFYQLLGENRQLLFSRQSIQQSRDILANQYVFLSVGTNTPLDAVLPLCQSSPLFIISLPWNDPARADTSLNLLENRKARAKISLLSYTKLVRYFCDLHRKSILGSYSKFHLEGAFEQLVTETHSLLTKETEDKIQVLLLKDNPNFANTLWDDLQRTLFFQLIALQNIVVALWKQEAQDDRSKALFTQLYYLIILLNDDLQNAQIRSQISIPLNWDIKTILFQLLLSSLHSSGVVLGPDNNSLAEPLSLLFMSALSLGKRYNSETLQHFIQGWEKREKYYNRISTLPNYSLWLSRISGKDPTGDLAKNFIIYDNLQSLFYQHLQALSEQLPQVTPHPGPIPDRLKQLLPLHAELTEKQHSLLQ